MVPLGGSALHPHRAQRLHEQVAAALVDAAHLAHAVLRAGERRGGGALHGAEHARVHVGLEAPVRVDDLVVADDGAGAPAGHVVALREAEDLDPDVRGSRRRQEARRHVAVVGDVGVGVVVDHDDVVRLREGDQPREEVVFDHGARRVVRVAHEDHLRLLERLRGDRIEVGQEAVLGHADGTVHGAASARMGPVTYTG